MKKATFTKMTQGTQEDYVPIVEAAMVHSENLPERIIEHLNMFFILMRNKITMRIICIKRFE